ncbi:hypothetical protein KY345_06695 [Candidatus Woesearchaeota archaeon]|nr:hypothetical protein [Candidatus Woesearchaeota archaeon]
MMKMRLRKALAAGAIGLVLGGCSTMTMQEKSCIAMRQKKPEKDIDSLAMKLEKEGLYLTNKTMKETAQEMFALQDSADKYNDVSGTSAHKDLIESTISSDLSNPAKKQYPDTLKYYLSNLIDSLHLKTLSGIDVAIDENPLDTSEDYDVTFNLSGTTDGGIRYKVGFCRRRECGTESLEIPYMEFIKPGVKFSYGPDKESPGFSQIDIYIKNDECYEKERTLRQKDGSCEFEETKNDLLKDLKIVKSDIAKKEQLLSYLMGGEARLEPGYRPGSQWGPDNNWGEPEKGIDSTELEEKVLTY